MNRTSNAFAESLVQEGVRTYNDAETIVVALERLTAPQAALSVDARHAIDAALKGWEAAQQSRRFFDLAITALRDARAAK